MKIWMPAMTPALTLALAMASPLPVAPLAANASSAFADPAYDYSELQVTNSSAVMSMAIPEAGDTTQVVPTAYPRHKPVRSSATRKRR